LLFFFFGFGICCLHFRSSRLLILCCGRSRCGGFRSTRKLVLARITNKSGLFRSRIADFGLRGLWHFRQRLAVLYRILRLDLGLLNYFRKGFHWGRIRKLLVVLVILVILAADLVVAEGVCVGLGINRNLELVRAGWMQSLVG
jgi:hypothetical protein